MSLFDFDFGDWSYDAPDVDLSDAIDISGTTDWGDYIPIEDYVSGDTYTSSDLNGFGDYIPIEDYVSGYTYTAADLPLGFLSSNVYSVPDSISDESFSKAMNDYYNNPLIDNPEAISRASTPGLIGQIDSGLQDLGKYLGTPGGRLGVSLFGAGVSALDAYKKNKLLKEAQKKQAQMLAERLAESKKYSSPVYFNLARNRVAPTSNGGAATWFSDNALSANKPNPNATGYFADGGSVLGFLKYMAAGKKLPGEREAEKEAERRRLQEGREGTMMEGAAKIRNRQQQLQDMEKAQWLARGGYVAGGTAGQDDKIHAMLSDGEYVFDADSVSSLGDGNNAAGAKKLDQMREAIRAHKRSAPNSEIPPKAKSTLAYLKGAK